MMAESLFVNEIITGHYFDAVVAATFAIVAWIGKHAFDLYKHLAEQKSKNFDVAKTFIDSPIPTNGEKEALKEILRVQLFQKYCGLYIEDHQFRQLLIQLKANHPIISWLDLKRAFKYLVRNDAEEFSIHFSIFNKMGIGFVFLVSGLYLSFGCLSILTAIIFHFGNNPIYNGLMLSGVILFITGVVFSTLNFPYYSARKISKAIESSKDNTIPFKNKILLDQKNPAEEKYDESAQKQPTIIAK